MNAFKIMGVAIGGIILMIALIWGLGFLRLGYFKTFAPKTENVRREVFEETQSYVQGKVQDLAKSYEEYDKAETMEDKDAIEQAIVLRFAEFDESKIQSVDLRNFLIKMRGF